MSLEEMVRILKVHEPELLQDGSIKKEKNITLKAIKRMPTKALKIDESSRESDDEHDSISSFLFSQHSF